MPDGLSIKRTGKSMPAVLIAFTIKSAARFYADYLAAWNYHLSYVAQVITPGEFTVMPIQVEEMYEPEVYGKTAPAHRLN